jgi:hypothetical protein
MGEELPDLPSNVVQVTRRIRRCESDTPAQVVLEHFAIEYARKVVTPYAERIRQLERELQTALKDGRKYQRKVDEKIMERRLQGVALLLKCSKCGADRSKEPCGNQQDCAMQGHAYIDGRTAGAAPAPAETVLAVEAPRSREWQPVTGPGQVRKGDKLRFKIGDRAYNERAKLILEPGTDKEEIVYDIGRNFYFITALVAGGRSNHKCVEVLAATPSPQQGKEGGND